MSQFDPVTMDLTDPTGLTEDGLKYPSALIPFCFESHGHHLLARFLLTAGKGPHPVAIVLHGFPGNEQNFDLAHALKRAGWNALIFHYRGTWGSRGEFSFARALEDVQAAVDFVHSERARTEFRCDPSRIVLIGHSMGGFLALHTAAVDRRIQAVAALAAFNFGAFGKWIQGVPERIEGTAKMFSRSILPVQGATEQGLITEILAHRETWDLEGIADQIRKIPMLVAYGSRDEISVPSLHHTPFMRAVAENRAASLQEREFNADHMFSDCRIALCREVLGWLKKATGTN